MNRTRPTFWWKTARLFGFPPKDLEAPTAFGVRDTAGGFLIGGGGVELDARGEKTLSIYAVGDKNAFLFFADHALRMHQL